MLGLHRYVWTFSSGGKEGPSWSRCAGFSLPWLLLLQSTGFRCVDSVVVALEQRSPTFLASGTGFMEDNFSVDVGRWVLLRQ